MCWRCGGETGEHEADGDGCAACRGRRLAWSRFVRLGAYEGELRRSLLELKFARWHTQGVVIGRALGERVACECDRLGLDRGGVVFVPVPMPWARRMARGVDHAHVLAAEAARVAGGRVVRALRARGGSMQVEVPASRRGANVRRRFVRKRAPKGSLVVVVDDIRTTGATLTAVCRAVRGIGAGQRSGDIEIDRVWAMAAAVTPRRDRGSL